jgi:hypothetical protein
MLYHQVMTHFKKNCLLTSKEKAQYNFRWINLVPLTLIKKIVKFRVKENLEKVTSRASVTVTKKTIKKIKNMLLIILYTIASIVGAFLFIALIMKREMSLSSEVIINRSQADVFNYIKHIKNQEYYSKWVMADPNSKITYTGVDGTVGFKAAWNSEMKNVGVGEQEITKITDGIGYDVILRFEKPFKGISYANATTQSFIS